MSSYPQNPESSALFRTLVFLKYGVTFRELICEIATKKDSAAHRKLMSVHRDYWRFLSGVPLQDMKLRFGSDHFHVVTQGFDFGFDRLTPEELADCLDEICPCSQKHSPDYLKKLRARIKHACLHLILEPGNVRREP